MEGSRLLYAFPLVYVLPTKIGNAGNEMGNENENSKWNQNGKWEPEMNWDVGIEWK
jgi:hypothetical protein